VALEAPFFGKNVQFHASSWEEPRGVAMSAALLPPNSNCRICPKKKSKQSVTGNGNASKEQVAKMLMAVLDMKELPKLLDASDAVAVAVCHHYQNGTGEKAKRRRGKVSQRKIRAR